MKKEILKSDIFQKRFTHKDFVDNEKFLLKLLNKMKNSFDAESIFVKLGWLYDQWAVSDFTKRKEHLQNRAKYYFKKVLRRQPREISALNGLGTVYLHEKRYLMSLRYYKMNHQLYRNSLTYNSIGNVYRQIGKIALARKSFKESLNLAKNLVEKKAAQYNLSQL